VSDGVRERLPHVKIRAAVLEEFGEPLVVQELDLAEPKAGEVLVRLGACGVCHTDLYTASGADPTGYAPCVLGHEGAGVVERVGVDVTLVSPGDHVITLFAPECGECVHCRSGRTNRCVAIRDQQGLGHLPDGTTRLSREGEPMRHFMGTSTFAEYTVMPEIALAKVSPEASLEGCAPFACGLSTGIGAALYTADVKAGSTCVVFGCGLVGLGAVIGCRLAGAERIVAIDRSEGRLASARHHGATDTRVAAEDVADWIRDETGGFGADYTFEATGNTRVMRQAVESAREAWGLATMVGVAGKGETLDIVPRFLITGRRVTGSSFGGVKGRTQVPLLVDRWLSGEIDVESLLSHRLRLDEVNRGFDLMEAQDGIRSVITF
jgi:S-(hydroxymethyl)glutathione dehydrogenase / alcohol dehydrogenase